MAARRGQAETLPFWVRTVAIPLAGLLLFLVFLHHGFPYDRLAGRFAERLGQATATQVRIGELEPRFSLLGPGVDAVGVTAIPSSGARIQIERAFLRPGWSLAWLRGRPALHLELAGVDLANLPVAAWFPGASLQGLADIRLDLVLGGELAEGSSRFDARDGSLALPGLPLAVPFTSFAGDLRFGGAFFLELVSAELEGPLVSALASGTLAHGASVASAPVQLDLDLTAQAGLQGPLQAAGIQLGPDGRKQLKLTGTLASPEFR